MGESNGSSGVNSKMYSVIHGKWTRRCTEDTPGAEKRINKKEVEVTEVHMSNLTNFTLTGMVYKKLDFGTLVEFSMFDEIGDALLSFTTNDQHLMTFCKMLPNIDLSQPMDLVLVLDKEKSAKKGKDCHGLIIKQGEEWVTHYYKKDVNGLPAFKKRRDGSYDSSDHDDFLLGVLEERFSGMMEAPSASPEPAPVAAPEDDGSDIPF